MKEKFLYRNRKRDKRHGWVKYHKQMMTQRGVIWKRYRVIKAMCRVGIWDVPGSKQWSRGAFDDEVVWLFMKGVCHFAVAKRSPFPASSCFRWAVSEGTACRPARAFFFWFWIHTASETSTAETHTDGGAVIRKPRSAWLEGTPAMDHRAIGKNTRVVK